MPIGLDAAGGSLAEPGFGRSDVLEMVGTELHEQSHLLTCDVSSGHCSSRPGYREPSLPAHAAAHRRGHLPTSPVELPTPGRARVLASSTGHPVLSLTGHQSCRGTGEPLIAIARAMKLARGTVHQYARAEEFPERAIRRPGHSIIDPYLAYFQTRLAQGCEDAAVLWREIRERGFTGTARHIRRWLGERRTKPARSAPHRRRGQISTDPAVAGGGTPRLPSPRQLAWSFVQPLAVLAAADAAAVARVEQDAEAAIIANLARRFTALVRACNVSQKTKIHTASADLNTWLADAGASGVPVIETFAAGLQKDHGAIDAALTTPWSNGQTEGQVNRLKLIKRQMFGHASFDLLRRRVLLAA
jgi:hypothetical protein